MINITLEFKGGKTHARAVILQPTGVPKTYHKEASTGAKAITALVEALIKEHAGEDWQCDQHAEMRGVVPGGKYRRPRPANRPQERMPV